jgi:hypothetical protein
MAIKSSVRSSWFRGVPRRGEAFRQVESLPLKSALNIAKSAGTDGLPLGVQYL